MAAPRDKGELALADNVYGEYDQETLDLEYDMRRRCPHFAETFAQMGVHNDRVVKNFECSLDVAFGDQPGEKLDIEATLDSFKRGIARGRAVSFVKMEPACSAELVVTLPDVLDGFKPKKDR